MVTVSSSDIEEALELLSLSPSCGMSPRLSGCDAQELSSSFDASSDLVEDRPEANDMATSVYVALTVEPLSYRAPCPVPLVVSENLVLGVPRLNGVAACLLDLRGAMLRSSRRALMLVATWLRIGPTPMIWPRACTLH
jgi:hypothetical protein